MSNENSKRIVQGTVVSDKGNKTITVQVERLRKHPKYGKYIKHYTKFYAHDEENVAKIGDIVRIRQTRPLSRMKRWRLLEVVRHQVA